MSAATRLVISAAWGNEERSWAKKAAMNRPMAVRSELSVEVGTTLEVGALFVLKLLVLTLAMVPLAEAVVTVVVVVVVAPFASKEGWRPM
jgi:hypothetical protein